MNLDKKMKRRINPQWFKMLKYGLGQQINWKDFNLPKNYMMLMLIFSEIYKIEKKKNSLKF